LGLAAYTRREFSQAKQEFTKAGTLASDNPEVLPAVLESYLASKDSNFPEEIASQFGNGQDPDPAVATRIASLFLQYSHPDWAALILEKLTTAHAESAEGWRMLGEAYDRQNKPEQAYRAYARAVEATPNSEENYIAFADFASAHGNNDYALKVIANGLQRVPGSPELLCERGLLLVLKAALWKPVRKNKTGLFHC
jgi:cytochrome c-type biogenesis protein CcmH/NrfG